MNPAERPTCRDLMNHPLLRKCAPPAALAPYVDRADKEVDRSYLDEVPK
jgi:hypothetical protein